MKFRWILLLALLLASCKYETPTPTEEPAEDVVAMQTEAPAVPPATEEPVETEVPTELPPTEPPPTEAPLTCVELLYPENAVEVPTVGKVTFEWTALEGAEAYLLTFTLPSGDTVDFETEGTTRDRNMEAFASGGEYQWNVTALNAAGEELCQSDFFTFTKAISDVAPESAPQDNGNNSGSGGGEKCWDGSEPINGQCPPVDG